jgi:hypothetical protein
MPGFDHVVSAFVPYSLDPQRRYLFVIDGSKAPRAAIHAVFGAANPERRCRHHKMPGGIPV